MLVLVAAPLDKRSRMYKLLAKHADDRRVRRRSRTGGCRAVGARPGWPRPASRSSRRRRGCWPRAPAPDVKRLRGDVDRLLLYALGQKRITLDDVREIAGPAALQDDWAMTNAIEAGRRGDALRQLALMLDAGAPPEKMLGQLGWLVRAKFPAIAPAASAGAVEAVFRTDLDLKRSAGDPRILLERLVVELCGGKRSERRRREAARLRLRRRSGDAVVSRDL